MNILIYLLVHIRRQSGRMTGFFKSGDEISIYEGQMDFSDEQLSILEKKWIFRKKYFDSLNIKSYWVTAPMKHNIYPEKRPFNITSSGLRRVEKLTQHFKINYLN